MEQQKVDRINELARMSKLGQLSPGETAERQALREEYLAEWRRGTEAALKDVMIMEPDGSKHKLKRKNDLPQTPGAG